MGEPVDITVYSREECHLCAVARSRLDSVSAETGVPVDVTEIHIDDEPELEAEYGDRVPVVFIEGDLEFTYTVDEDKLATTLATAE
jgi:glutaredoxin